MRKGSTVWRDVGTRAQSQAAWIWSQAPALVRDLCRLRACTVHKIAVIPKGVKMGSWKVKKAYSLCL